MTDAAYFLTFRTYGTWLHGDRRGSVDRRDNGFGEPLIPRDDGLLRRRQSQMKDSPMMLDTPEKRQAVRDAIARTCEQRAWTLLAVNVRTNHVHVVLVAAGPIEKASPTPSRGQRGRCGTADSSPPARKCGRITAAPGI